MRTEEATPARLRLALLRQRYNPFGGAERFIERAIEALEREGAEVTLITRAWRGAGADVQRHPRALIVDPFYIGRMWRDASFARRVRALLATERFDLVQSHERIAGCDLYRAGDGIHRQWLSFRAQHAAWPERLGIRLNPYHWYVCAAERALFEHPGLRAVICNSRMIAAEIRRHFAIAADKLHVIYNGVDTDHFSPRARATLRADARSAFGLAEREFALLFVGSGFARKGLDTALRALAAANDASLRLIVVGRDRSAARFARLARSLGVGERVRFCGGVEDVRPCYAAADALVLPTLYDPFPNVVLEALAMGVPVIVSDQCGAAEVITHGANGFVCRAGEPAALAGLFRALLQADCRALGERARAAVEPFGIARMGAQLLALYRRLIAEGRAARAAATTAGGASL